MKKLFGILLVLVFTVMFSTLCLAAPEGTGVTTGDKQYDEVIADGDTPLSGEVINDGTVPLAKTGGIPAEAFYAMGGLCVISALVITTRKNKAAQSK